METPKEQEVLHVCEPAERAVLDRYLRDKINAGVAYDVARAVIGELHGLNGPAMVLPDHSAYVRAN